MNLSNIFGPSKTYDSDLKLFQKLGLKTFSVDDQNELFVGEHKYSNDNYKYSVKIWVTCMPAQFWRFEIETAERKHFEVSTGSGSLADYWESVMKIADGLFVVKPKQK